MFTTHPVRQCCPCKWASSAQRVVSKPSHQKSFANLIKCPQELASFTCGYFQPVCAMKIQIDHSIGLTWRWGLEGVGSRTWGWDQAAQCWPSPDSTPSILLPQISGAGFITYAALTSSKILTKHFFPSLVYSQRWKSLIYKILEYLNKINKGELGEKSWKFIKTPPLTEESSKAFCLVQINNLCNNQNTTCMNPSITPPHEKGQSTSWVP